MFVRQVSPIVLVLALASIACPTREANDVAATSTSSSPAEPVQPEPVEPPPRKPPAETPDDDAVALAEGDDFMCALQRAGTVACWGDDRWGQLGQQEVDGEGPVLVPGLVDVVAIAATANMACAARRDGTVICWGQGWRRLEQQTQVHGATALSGAIDKQQICAVTADGTVCWGAPHGRGRVPWKENPEERPGVVEVSAFDGHECLVHSSGVVTCDAKPKPRELERLHGARQLSRVGIRRDVIAGILPDGSLAAESLEDGEPRTFADGRDIVALAPGIRGSEVAHAIRRDGRVFAWEPEREGSSHYLAREIVLPDPQTVGSNLALTIPLPELPKNSILSGCDVNLHIVSPVDVGSLAEILSKTLDSSEGDHQMLCDSMSVGPRDCPADGPWFVQQEDGEFRGEYALVVPLGEGRFGRVPELGEYSEGTEEKSRATAAMIRSRSPVDAYLMIEAETMLCDDGCGWEDHYDTQVVITELPNRGAFLVTEVIIERQSEKRAFTPAQVTVSGNAIELKACDSQAQVTMGNLGVP